VTAQSSNTFCVFEPHTKFNESQVVAKRERVRLKDATILLRFRISRWRLEKTHANRSSTRQPKTTALLAKCSEHTIVHYKEIKSSGKPGGGTTQLYLFSDRE